MTGSIRVISLLCLYAFLPGLRLGMYTPIKEAIMQAVSGYGTSPSSSSSSSVSYSWQAEPISMGQQQQQSLQGRPELQQQQQQQVPSGGKLTSKQQFFVKVLAGVTSGGVAATICSPTELIKVRVSCRILCVR